MTARVLLLNPPSETVGAGNQRLTRVLYPPPPGGLASVAACLLRAGHEVVIRDLVLEPCPTEVLVQQALALRPDAIGFSVLGPTLASTRELSSRLKTALPGVHVFAGNALPSEYPAWFLDEVPACDAVVVGEGEQTAVELVDSGFSRPVAGAVRRGDRPEDFEIRPQISDLDSLPFPAWQLLPYRKYRASPQLLFRSAPTLGVLQSRGCPWSCGFCAQNYLWPQVRVRSLDSVAEELKRNLVDFGVRHHGFFDSIFPLKKGYGAGLHESLQRAGLLGKLRLFCETRADMVWEEDFTWLRKAGLHLVFLGIESPSEALLRTQDKIRAMYDVRQAVATLARLKLRSYGLFVLGLPGEVAADREALLELALSLPLDVASFGLYTRYPGSPTARQEGAAPQDLTSCNWGDVEELAAEQRRMMKAFYLRPALVARHLLRREIAMDRLLAGAFSLLAGPGLRPPASDP